MQLWKYVLRRTLAALPILFLVSVLVFAIIRLAPGDPIRIMVGIGSGVTEDTIKNIRAQWGLDDPLYVQYGKWLAHMVQGDFGQSISSQVPVSELLAARIPATLKLNIVGYLMAFAIALPIGIVSATRQYSAVDFFGTAFALFGISIPNFWLGLMLMYLFSLRLGWLPTSGTGTWAHYVLPGFTLGVGLAGGMVRMLRSSLLDVLRQDYVTVARAKGLAEVRVLMKHALKNALIPVVTLLGFYLAYILSGTILIETIFAWPGMGRLSIQALYGRDYPVVQAVVLVGAAMVVVANVVVDIVYAFLDPRIRYE